MIPHEQLFNHTPLSTVSEFVETIIASVDCVEDINPELIKSIRCEIGRALPIPRFPITLRKFLEWEASQPPESLQGFDYDGRLQRLLVRPRLILPARGALKGVISWLRTTVDRLGDNDRKNWSIVKNKPYMLTGNYFGMVKRPQTALIKANQTWPSVVVYVETNETETEVLDNVKQWLYGSNGDVKLVVVIATREENIPPSESSWLNGLDCRSWSDPYQLAEVIYKVESKEEKPSIVGQIVTSVWLMAPGNCSEDTNRLPSYPFYRFTCDLRRGLNTGSISNFFGVSCVDSHSRLLLENVKVPFPFKAFDDFVKQGAWDFLRDRSQDIAIRLWNECHQRGRQDEEIGGLYGLGDLPVTFPHH